MTTVLGLDSADQTASAAVAVDGVVRAEVVERSSQRHSERLFAMVEQVMRGAAVERDALDCVAVTHGPGSFTGLRVGIATAQGVAFSLGLPVVGVSTTRSMAVAGAPYPGTILPLLDARKRQVYAAAYCGRTGVEVLAEQAWDPGALAELLVGRQGPVLAIGSGLGPYAETFRNALGARLDEAPPPRWGIRAGVVALLGAEAYTLGKAVPPARLTPVYCRLSEAEEARLGRTASRGSA